VNAGRIGVAACTWGLEPGYPWVPGYDADEVLAAAARLGFAGFEPATDSGPGAVVAKSAAAAGVVCPARFVGLALAEPAAARDHGRAALADLLDLGGDFLLIGIESAGDTRPLAELADSCAEVGVTPAIHPELGGPVATARAVDELLAASPALTVCLDTGHFWAAGDGDLPRLVRDWGGRLSHVHLKDVDGARAAAVRDGEPVGDAVQAGLWRPLGDGDVPLEDTLAALDAAGYDGWLIVEHDFAADPEESAERSLAWLTAHA
jgi:inosose dehydratase